MKIKKIVFDIDGTLCDEVGTFEKTFALPKKAMINLVNESYSKGIFVILYTARSWAEYKLTEVWLLENKVNYNLLICGKPNYDLWIDDRCLNPDFNITEIMEKIKNV